MTTGTITLTNKSTAVTGSGTAFATELAVGGFIVATVGGTPYTLGIQAIGSDTAMTLTQAYDGPTTSGVAFDYVPLATLNLITSALASQVSYAIRGLNLDKNNWQAVFSISDDITVSLPDGSSFDGPSWLKIVDLLNDIDIATIQSLADQIDADANQVAADKTTASNAATTATSAAQTATDKATAANTSATNAASSATAAAASATSASGSATTATQQADRAESEAERAEQAANQAGGVQTVNGISPDSNGAVTIGMSDIQGTVTTDKGGTGATTANQGWINLLTGRTAAAARSDLGLGNAATLNTGFGVDGNVMLQGQYGLGTILNNTGQTAIPLLMSGFYGESSAAGWKPQTAGSGVITGYDSIRRQMYFISANGSGFYVRSISGGEYNASASTYAWTQMQAVGTSDINLKNVLGDLDVNEALVNINAMEFKRFTYKDDESAAERRGVIAQQVENIDPQYVHSAEGVGKMTLDLNPLLMDALAAIKALSAKVDALNAEIAELKGSGS